MSFKIATKLKTGIYLITMHGDFNITDDEESIKKLMNQEYEIRR